MRNEDNNKLRTVTETTVNLADLVPEDERALSADDSKAGYEMVIGNVTVSPAEKGLSGLVPEDEVSVDSPNDDSVALAEEAGLFSPVIGMSQIRGVLGDNIYGSISVDEKGLRYFNFSQRYENGKFSEKISVPQADLYRLALCQRAKQEQQATGSQKSRDKLPVHKAKGQQSAQTLYQDIMRVFKTHMVSNVSLSTLRKKSYFVLPSEDFEILARYLDMSSMTLRKKLAEYNLLYLTGSSVGYQSKIRYPDGETVDCYCIYDLEYFRKIKKQATADTI